MQCVSHRLPLPPEVDVLVDMAVAVMPFALRRRDRMEPRLAQLFQRGDADQRQTEMRRRNGRGVAIEMRAGNARLVVAAHAFHREQGRRHVAR